MHKKNATKTYFELSFEHKKIIILGFENDF
jgi:hypothetical protein